MWPSGKVSALSLSGLGSIPGRVTKIPQATQTQCSNKNPLSEQPNTI